MYRLSVIINDVYNKYLPEAIKGGIQFNLDFPDTTAQVRNPQRVKNDLDKNVSSALKRAPKGEVSIKVRQGEIVITDTGTVLSKAAIAIVQSNEHIKVKSRVGFGTEVKISF